MSRHDVSEGLFFLDRAHGRTLQGQLREVLVAAVLDGRIPPGSRMPSTRRLAGYLGIARITVTQAYQELVAQGFLAARPRSGYVVSEEAIRPMLEPVAASAAGGRPDWGARLRGVARRPHVEKPHDWRSYPYPFVYGQMDMSLFDHGAWRDCAWQALGRRDFEAMAGDMEAADDPMLVNYIWSRALPRRGISASPEQILVTVGAQNALWLTAQLLAGPRVHAVCENPGYPDFATLLRWNGARVTRIDIDEEGLPPERLPDDTDLVFVTPSHQAPTAVTLPAARRRRLLERASEQDFLVVEDDYDFEMSFLAPPGPALKSMDRDDRVVYVGSFSKVLFPGLRLGYLVGPEPFIREARQVRALMLRHPPGHLQRTAAYFLALGHYDSLIRDLRRSFAERREVMTRALAREGIEIANAARFGGTNFWIRGPQGLDSVRFAQALRADGVLVEAGAPFFDDPDEPVRFFRMAYSSIAAERIDEGVRRIARRLFGR